MKRENRSLRGERDIAVRADRALRSHKVAKHFVTTATDDGFSWERDEERIAAEAALDGVCVIRTSVDAGEIGAEDAVRAYKGLSRVERAFRCLKGVDLKVRPVHHRLEGRVRAHVFLCMLAYHVEWHMRRALAPMLFHDHDAGAAEAERASPVDPARRSEAPRAKAGAKRTADGLPAHSFRSLLADLATLTRNRVRPAAPGAATADMLARPTPLQAKAFRLLGVRPRPVPSSVHPRNRAMSLCRNHLPDSWTQNFRQAARGQTGSRGKPLVHGGGGAQVAQVVREGRSWASATGIPGVGG